MLVTSKKSSYQEIKKRWVHKRLTTYSDGDLRPVYVDGQELFTV